MFEPLLNLVRLYLMYFLCAPQLTLAFNGGSSGPSQDVPVGAGGVATLTDVAVPNFKLWSVGAGNLYTLKVSDGVIGDAIEVGGPCASVHGSVVCVVSPICVCFSW